MDIPPLPGQDSGQPQPQNATTAQDGVAPPPLSYTPPPSFTPDSNRYSNNAEEGFSAGTVITSTFSVLFGNPLPYLVLALLSNLPEILIPVFWSDPITGETTVTVTIIQLGTQVFISVIFTAALAFCVYRDLIGQRATLGESIARGLSSYPALLGFGFLVVSTVVIVLFLLIMLQTLALMVVFAILSFYFSCALCVTIPACVAEGIGVYESIHRSLQLTKGRRLSIFGMMILWGIGQSAAIWLFGTILPHSVASSTITSVVVGVIFVAIYQVGVATVYFHLRRSDEGVSIDKLANVFD